MTDLVIALAAAAIGLPMATAASIALLRSSRAAALLSRAAAPATGGVALALGCLALARPEAPVETRAFLVDGASGVFVVVIAVVGLLSALLSAPHVGDDRPSVFRAETAPRWYYASLHAFWALLLAIPVVGNLGVAWLLVEATTAASALLVAYTGRRSALEAGWKYLVLTTAGLTLALLGIVILFASSGGTGFETLDWAALPGAVAGVPDDVALVAFVLLLVGLAAKIGWAPVHNWLPDAHSEAPPPVSALLSAALLPTVMLVAWRVKGALEPAVGTQATRTVFLAFGLASLAVAVPFLWRPLAWKRLLAYSSLEHMGVLALGIGFGHRVAIAGVVLHVGGHALAKALGFYASTSLLALQPSAARRPPTGLARTSRPLAGAVGLSLASLAGVPPSPLFFSELFVLIGGALAGQLWVVAGAAALLALGFLGLAHTLVEGLAGKSRRREEPAQPDRLVPLTGLVAAGLAGLSAAAYFLPGSDLVEAIARLAG